MCKIVAHNLGGRGYVDVRKRSRPLSMMYVPILPTPGVIDRIARHMVFVMLISEMSITRS